MFHALDAAKEHPCVDTGGILLTRRLLVILEVSELHAPPHRKQAQIVQLLVGQRLLRE